jgi:MFS family permease
MQTIERLRGKRSFVFALIAISIFALFSYAISVFLPSLLIRTYHAGLAQVSINWGSVMAVANLTGAVAGGWLADRLSRRDMRWYAWLPAIACVLGAPLYWLAFHADTFRTFIAIEFVAESILGTGLPVVFAAMLAVCGASRRAMTMAITQFSLILFGAGFGPLLTGFLSDLFTARYGQESLRYSLIAMLIFLVPAAAAFYESGRHIAREIEE